ncbi:hypothetical protein P691DRAFT_766406 [Macrolepiota fuliginosa MF-IS2]|uniref:Uncharacterized protein n=1 Tax=Macrolepiota fuliginosa MF-IS2 TaxID=1400762 RepID=A0A9P5WYR3_9AGAR|nr:hypothetical protein P691DRAFT_766406 [Macrolepiota fuliginosa MF-IS2]
MSSEGSSILASRITTDIRSPCTGFTAIDCVGCNNGINCLIKGTKVHTSTPQCQQCWKWGHPSDYAGAQPPTAPSAQVPIIGTCIIPWQVVAKATPRHPPPIPPTPANVACPHVGSCVNCSAKHTADVRCCPYWCHHFNWDWIKSCATQDALAKKKASQPVPTPSGPPPPQPATS